MVTGRLGRVRVELNRVRVGIGNEKDRLRVVLLWKKGRIRVGLL